MITAFSTSYREHPAVFPAGREEIFGILTVPAYRPIVGDGGAILLTGGGFIPGGHRNRMWVHLARRLAGMGIPALRFDYRGVGESSGLTLDWWLDRPFSDDLTGAARWLRGHGVRRLALVGTCFGARTILGAAEQIDDLAGIALFSVPLRSARWGELAATRFADDWSLADYLRRAVSLRVLRRLLDARWRGAYLRVVAVKARRLATGTKMQNNLDGIPEGLRWVSPRFLQPLVRLARRRVPMLVLYGSEEEEYQEFHQAMAGGLADLLRESKGAIEVRTVKGVLHGYTTVQTQRITVEHASTWIAERLAPDAMASTR